MSKRELLKKEFGALYFDKGCCYFSDGNWNLHDLLDYLLSLSGEANVLISSYSISEASVREFLRLKEEGCIMSLRVLLDLSVKSQKGSLLFFANNVADEIRLAANHSKIIIIEGETRFFTVLSSANFTVNPRYECGFITTDNDALEFFKNKLSQAFEKALPLHYG